MQERERAHSFSCIGTLAQELSLATWRRNIVRDCALIAMYGITLSFLGFYTFYIHIENGSVQFVYNIQCGIRYDIELNANFQSFYFKYFDPFLLFLRQTSLLKEGIIIALSISLYVGFYYLIVYATYPPFSSSI